jgi:hypothetical protein
MKSRCECLFVGRTSHNKGPWSIDLSYSSKSVGGAMFSIGLTPEEALELAARLMAEAGVAKHENAKRMQGGAA